MVLVKAPVALTAPSVVLLSAVVGLTAVAQTTPCWVGLGTPRAGDVAVACGGGRVIAVTAWVVTVGAESVKVTSSP